MIAYIADPSRCVFFIYSRFSDVIQKIDNKFLVSDSRVGQIFFVEDGKLNNHHVYKVENRKVLSEGLYKFAKEIDYTIISGFKNPLPLLKKISD
mgnify:CR=1 FL=1